MGDVSASTRKLAALDLLRFACAVLVLAAHYCSSFARAPSTAAAQAFDGLEPTATLLPQTWFGWIGVELFFVISGFVIALSARTGSTGQFARRRVLRLVPAAWICGTITAIALLWSGIYAPSDVALRWAGSSLFIASMPQIDASYWTLGVEVNFYLLVGLCLWRGGFAALEALPKALALASAAFWAVHLLSGPGIDMAPSLGLYLLLLPHGCFFAVGMMLEQRARVGAIASPAIFALGLVTCALEIANVTSVRMAAMSVPSGFFLPMIVFAAGMLVIVKADRLTIGGRWAPVATLLGLATYPLYLIHQDAGAVMAAALVRAGLSFPVSLAITAASVIMFAMLCTKSAEPRLRRRIAAVIEAIAQTRRPAAAGTAPGL